MKLTNGKDFRVNLWRRLKIAAKALLGEPVTMGEIAEANGEGPCARCVGRSVVAQSEDRPRQHKSRR